MDIMMEYIKLYSPIYQGLENRIQFVDSASFCYGMNCSYSVSNYPSSGTVSISAGGDPPHTYEPLEVSSGIACSYSVRLLIWALVLLFISQCK